MSFSVHAETVEKVREHFSRTLVFEDALGKTAYYIFYRNVHKYVKCLKRA